MCARVCANLRNFAVPRHDDSKSLSRECAGVSVAHNTCDPAGRRCFLFLFLLSNIRLFNRNEAGVSIHTIGSVSTIAGFAADVS